VGHRDGSAVGIQPARESVLLAPAEHGAVLDLLHYLGVSRSPTRLEMPLGRSPRVEPAAQFRSTPYFDVDGRYDFQEQLTNSRRCLSAPPDIHWYTGCGPSTARPSQR